MAWLELHQSLARHPKTYALARILSQRRPTIIGMLCLLWLWALDNKTSKVDLDPSSLADVMDWTGDKDLLLDAMVQCHWLDRKDDGLYIHDWEEYVGKLLERRESNRLRQKQFRDKNILLLRNKNVTVMSQLRNIATVPYRTIPYHTVPLIKNIDKKVYGEFKNVLLTDDEYKKLEERFNSSLPAKIEELSQGIASKDYKYKSHYATILSWDRKHERENIKNEQQSRVSRDYRGNPSQKPAGAFDGLD